MSSSMRSSAIIASLNGHKAVQLIDLRSYFQTDSLREPKAAPNWDKSMPGALGVYIYKSGTPFETRLWLRTRPTSAESFYELALALIEGTAAYQDNHFYDDLTYTPSEESKHHIDSREKFAVSLLLDAAQSDYPPAKKLLARLQEETGYQAAIQWSLEQNGYRLIGNKAKIKEEEFWLKGKPPKSLSALERLGNALRVDGAVGSNYFLQDPTQVTTVLLKIKQIANQEAEKLSIYLKQKYDQALELANQGNIVEIKQLIAELKQYRKEEDFPSHLLGMQYFEEALQTAIDVNKENEPGNENGPGEENKLEIDKIDISSLSTLAISSTLYTPSPTKADKGAVEKDDKEMMDKNSIQVLS